MKLHPFTPFVATAGTAILAFALPAPGGQLALYGAVSLLAVLAGEPRAVRTAVLLSLTIWGFLWLLHVLLPGGRGAETALAQGARIGAVATVSVYLLRTFDASALLDAFAERGWPFTPAYLMVATMQAAPRLRARAASILEAQRARGLRVGRSPIGRIRALAPLTLPLLLGTIAEVDDRALALESRGLGRHRGVARTALAPPAFRLIDTIVCWGTALAVAGALAVRVSA